MCARGYAALYLTPKCLFQNGFRENFQLGAEVRSLVMSVVYTKVA